MSPIFNHFLFIGHLDNLLSELEKIMEKKWKQ